MAEAPDGHTFVFICGLNRSGTTLLARALADHPLVSGFNGTPAPKDEGMHLQSVYPTDRVHGGAGKFAFRSEAHLTEASPLATPANGETLWREWSRWWDLSQPVLLEKSPTNLIRTRFLQALLPNARFLVVTRHPVAVALATQKWSKTSIDSLIRHWLRAHDLFVEDRAHLAHAHMVSYESLIADPQSSLDGVYQFLELDPHPTKRRFRSDGNRGYFDRWAELRNGPLSGIRVGRVERKHEALVQQYGYSLLDLSTVPR
jgi:hypothetical protein